MSGDGGLPLQVRCCCIWYGDADPDNSASTDSGSVECDRHIIQEGVSSWTLQSAVRCSFFSPAGVTLQLTQSVYHCSCSSRSALSLDNMIITIMTLHPMNNPVLTLSQSMTDGRIELGGGPRNTNDWLSGGLQDGFRLIDVVV